jgi:hypothetical protein
LPLDCQIIDWHEINSACIGAIDRERIDFACVRAPRHNRVSMMYVRTAGRKPDRPFVKTPGLALQPPELGAVVDNEVVARVLAERQQHREADVVEGEHDRKR